MSDAIGLPKLKAFPGGSLYSLGGPKEPADHSDGHVGDDAGEEPHPVCQGTLGGIQRACYNHITRTNRLNEEMLRKCSNNSEKGG